MPDLTSKELVNLYREWKNSLIQQIRKAITEGKGPEELRSIVTKSLDDNFWLPGLDIYYINEIIEPFLEFEDLDYSISLLENIILDSAIAAVLLAGKSKKLFPRQEDTDASNTQV